MSSDNVWKRLFDLRAAIDKMIVDGNRDAEKVADVLQTVVDGVARTEVCLKRLFVDKTIKVPAMSGGAHTFERSGIFTGGIHRKTFPVVEKPEPTAETGAAFYEHDHGAGYLSQFFMSIGEEGQGEWTEAQVVQICMNHLDKLQRCREAHTYFRVKGGFIAWVHFDSHGQLRVRVRRLSRAKRYFFGRGGTRFVVPL